MEFNIQFFGGRGASSGGGNTGSNSTPGSGGGLGTYNAKSVGDPDGYGGGVNGVGDYDGGGNPDLIAWQNMSEADMGHYLHQISSNTDLSQDANDQWAYHDNPFQKFVKVNNLNNPATVMNETDFQNYLKQTGQTEMYRAVSGTSAKDRFMNSPNNHVGNGIYGDGHYATLAGDIGTARGYGSTIMRMAFSPQARVIDINTLQAKINALPTKARRALKKAGSEGPRTYGTNIGEAQMALKLGYNVIRTSWSNVILTRDAVVVSTKTTR